MNGRDYEKIQIRQLQKKTLKELLQPVFFFCISPCFIKQINQINGCN
jgi:hypothetical protein